MIASARAGNLKSINIFYCLLTLPGDSVVASSQDVTLKLLPSPAKWELSLNSFSYFISHSALRGEMYKKESKQIFVTLNSLRMYWGMLYSASGSTTKYWYLRRRKKYEKIQTKKKLVSHLADRSLGQYWAHFSCKMNVEWNPLNCNNLFPDTFVHSIAQIF